MALSPYHLHHVSRSDAEVLRRGKVKELEITQILEKIPFQSQNEPLRVGVLGCAEKRFVKIHKKIFEKIFQRPTELVTFDISIEHLSGEEHIVQHDCTKPLPEINFDILFGHVLLKFIETEKQLSVLLNSYEALSSPGLAIHVFDAEDIETTAVKQSDGYWSVPLERWKTELENRHIHYQELHWEIESPGEGLPIRGIKGGALVLIR